MNASWDLTHIYASEAEFERDLAHFVNDIIPSVATYEGKLSDEETLKAYLKGERELTELLTRLYSYAHMSSDLDKKDTARLERLSKVELAYQKLIEAVSFEEPELLSLGKEKLDDFLARNPEFSDYSFSFEKLFRGQKYVLGLNEEKLLSSYVPLLGEGGDLYSALSVGDYVPDSIKLSDGKEVTVSLNNWTSLIGKTEKAEDRKAIFESLYKYFDARKSAYGEIYNTTLRGELAVMKSRGYASIADSHLYGKAIPVSVLTNLIEVASSNTAPLKKYYELRRKALGLEKHRSYDRFLELAKSDETFTYEEARNLFYDSLKSLPEDYQEKAREVTKEGYVDVYPGSGKRTGAYSTGGEGVHPFILLNFNGELDDVFTLAHEAGHSIHTLYSMESQPILKQGYTIFVAEIASTFNEHNLLDYLLEKGELTKQTRIALLQKAIDEICATFYRQTLFGQYEYEIAKLAEEGKPINYQVLSDKMTELYEKYYGIDIREEKYKPLVWAYIPHLFYTPFYVYQYATSFTASMLLYENVKEGKPGAFENHVNLLRSGGSDYPVEQVKKAGVDLTTKEPFLAVIKRMEYLVDELEKALNE